MKSPTNIILIFALALFASCAGKKEVTSTAFQIQVGNLVSGAALNGGVLLSGNSDLGDSFNYATADANNVSISLPEGVWNFRVIGWKQAVDGAMTGDNVCSAVNDVDISGANASISMTLNQSNCVGFTPIAQSALSFEAGVPGRFNEINFQSCMNVAGLGNNPSSATICDNTGGTNDLKMGMSAFIRVRVRNIGSITLPEGELISKCISVDTYTPPTVVDFTGSSFNSRLRLPVKNDSTAPFPLEIISYEKAGCVDQDSIYFFPHGLGGERGNGTASLAYDAPNNGKVNLAWSDNFFGSEDSAFRDAISSAILPFIGCAGPTNSSSHCHNVGQTTRSNLRPRDQIRDNIFDLFGSQDLVDSRDRVDSATVSGTLTNAGSGITININSTTAVNNDLYLNFVAGSPGVNFTASGNNINVEIGTGQTGTIIATALNVQLPSNYIATCSSNCTAFWTPNPAERLNLLLPLKKDERRLGIIQEIKNLLLGPIGGILYDNGLTSLTNICSAPTPISFEESKLNEGTTESIEVELTTGSIIPPDYITIVAPPHAFDRRLTVSFDGVPDMAVEFNCPANGELEEMWFAHYKNDDRLQRIELFINHSDTIDSAIERVNFEVSDSNERRSWEYFQKIDDSEYRFFQIAANEESPGFYSRTSANVKIHDTTASGTFLVNSYSTLLTNDTEIHFNGNINSQAPDHSCDYSGNFLDPGNCTVAVTTEAGPTSVSGPGNTIAAPFWFADFSVNGLQALTETDFEDL